MGRLTSLLDRPLNRYLTIGGFVYIFELTVIVIAQSFGASPIWSVGISFVLGTAVSFLMQKFITFHDKRLHRKVVVPQIIVTTLLLCWNLGFSLLLTKLLEQHLAPVLTRTIALLITTAWNFYLYKTRIFKTAPATIG